jgi:hypothetical protein
MYQCLSCGKHTDYAGNKGESGLDQNTKDALLSRINRVPANPVGNFADLQRAGGKILAGQADSFADGVEPPPGRSEDEIQDNTKAVEKVEAAAAKAADEADQANAKATAAREKAAK